jgi:prepilin-type N-terminal cleavage/methylation domain-containing protein
MRARYEAGFTLVETIVVTAIVALIAGTAGTFFLAGATPAVATANRDVVAAFDEARRTAIAFDAATLVFAPAPSGSGYSARVYERTPGDPAFRPRNGPAFDSTVTIGETASPLGAPGFAFTIDGHGNIAALANYSVSGSDFVNRACPPSGAFTLQLTYAHDERTVTIPCAIGTSSAAALALETPPAALVPAPAPAQTCPATSSCAFAPVAPAAGATCPAGLTPDPATPGLCDATAPPPAGTCPPGFTGTPPNCAQMLGQVTPTPAPTTTASMQAISCRPGQPDALGFATCLDTSGLVKTGPAITRESCGTHTPIVDPGPQINAVVEVFQNDAFWGSYAVTIATQKAPWIDLSTGGTDCGLKYTLLFRIEGVAATSGNARTTPSQDTDDPGIVDEGVASIIVAPVGAPWGSNT